MWGTDRLQHLRKRLRPRGAWISPTAHVGTAGRANLGNLSPRSFKQFEIPVPTNSCGGQVSPDMCNRYFTRAAFDYHGASHTWLGHHNVVPSLPAD